MPLIFHLIPSDSSLRDDDPSNPRPSLRLALIPYTYIYIFMYIIQYTLILQLRAFSTRITYTYIYIIYFIHSDFYLISKLFCNAHGVRVTALLTPLMHTHIHTHTHLPAHPHTPTACISLAQLNALSCPITEFSPAATATVAYSARGTLI